MSLWRLEVLRMVRSPRGLVLGGVYLFFGLLGPVMAKYMTKLTDHVTGSVKIVVPPPTSRDGMINYVGQTSQTGMIVVVVIAAGALSLDARRGLSVFYRTRAAGLGALIVPRYVVMALAAMLAQVLGTLGCWYGSELLLGNLPAGDVLAGLLCSAVQLAFCVAVVALAASVTRGVLGTIGLSLGILLLLPLLGTIGAIHDWLPSTLIQAPAELLSNPTLSDYLPSLAVGSAAVPLLLMLAVRRFERREVG
jgi:ABC-2 type transport system permease protein